MAVAKFVKDNLVLVVGLTLPLLLMAGFLAVSVLPDRIDPPKYDLLFATQDNGSGALIPLTVTLVVRDRVLMAQYTKLPPTAGFRGWKKLFVYEAASGKVRELPFGVPGDLSAIDGTREDTVEATVRMRLDTTLQAPDGYELAFGDRRGGGLLLELFGGSRNYEARLRKGGHSLPLTAGTGDRWLYGVEFVGWVTGRN